MVKKIYLLDTNIVSDGSKTMPSELVKEKLDLYSDFCAISSITWYELQTGIKRMSAGRKTIFQLTLRSRFFHSLKLLPMTKTVQIYKAICLLF